MLAFKYAWLHGLPCRSMQRQRSHLIAAAMASSDMKGTWGDIAVRTADAVAGPMPCHSMWLNLGTLMQQEL